MNNPLKFILRSGKPKLCIMSLYSYPLFNPECKSAFGGSEVRVSIIAKELARRGKFDVNLIVFDHGQPHIEVRDNVRIISWTGLHGPVMLPQPCENKIETSELPSVQLPPSQPLPIPSTPVNTISTSIPHHPREIFLHLESRARNFIHYLKVNTPDLMRPLAHKVYALLKRCYHLLRRVGKKTVNLLRSYKGAINSKIADEKIKLQKRREIFGKIGDYIVQKSRVWPYQEVNADLYMMPGNNSITAELSYFCQHQKRPYIFLSGSDMDYNADHLKFADHPDLYGSPRKLMVYTIQSASIHVVQNDNQQKLLQKNYKRSSIIVKNPIGLEMEYPKQQDPSSILWVGKSDQRVKQPELLLDLTEKFSNYHFIMVLNRAIPETHERCLARAKHLSNLEIIEYIKFDEIERLFACAKLFINTSVFEGFPNTFLQSAKYGVPILSLQVDPGQMLTEHGCGVNCCGDINQLALEIDRLMQNRKEYELLSANCRDYIRHFHAKDVIIAQYEDILAKALKYKHID